ncbi:hypothetical protein [Aeoliella sp.]|uniref:hypothetical protein n=1 Tax=Aeoliella sp. TaxID=2795800 RepID=UPI003CCC3976
MKSKHEPVLIALVFIGILLAMPIILPCMVVSDARRKRRLRRCARTTVCEECGQLLGDASIELSNLECQKSIEKLNIKPSRVNHRRVRQNDAICPNCKAEYRFVPKRSELLRVWECDVGTIIDHQRRDLPDSPTKRALRAAVLKTPQRYDSRWLLVYETSPKVLYDPKTGDYALLGLGGQVTEVGDVAGVVSTLEELA